MQEGDSAWAPEPPAPQVSAAHPSSALTASLGPSQTAIQAFLGIWVAEGTRKHDSIFRLRTSGPQGPPLPLGVEGKNSGASGAVKGVLRMDEGAGLSPPPPQGLAGNRAT